MIRTSTILTFLVAFILFSCTNKEQKSNEINAAFVGSWESNQGMINLDLTVDSFILSTAYSGNMTPTSKGLIEIEGNQMTQTVTHVWFSMVTGASGNDLEWYTYDEYVQKLSMAGSNLEQVEARAQKLFTSSTQTWELNAAKDMLKIGVANFTLKQ